MQQVLKALSLLYWQIRIYMYIHMCAYIYIDTQCQLLFFFNNLGTTLEASSVLYNNFSTQIQGIFGYIMVGKIMGSKTYLGLHLSSTTYKLCDPGYVT